MSETANISTTDAICQVIADGGVTDFVDVVNEVKRRFQLDVSQIEVQEIYEELANKNRKASQVSLGMTAKLPDEDLGRVQTNIAPATHSDNVHAQVVSSQAASSTPKSQDDLTQALQFVKSVGGLANAKRLLIELESTLLGP